MTMETVILKNGSEEVKSLVAVVMMSINRLWDEMPIACFELVSVCRDRYHKPFGNTGEKLKQLHLMESDGSVHDSIKNVVLSMTCGEGFDMTLGSPIADSKDPTTRRMAGRA